MIDQRLELLARPELLPFVLPILLWVLVPALLARRRFRGPSYWLAAGSRLVLALVLLWFLAGPEVVHVSELPARLEIHVDLSASMSPTAREAMLDRLETQLETITRREPELSIETYGFAGAAELIAVGDLDAFRAARRSLRELGTRLEPMASRPDRSLAIGRARRHARERLGRVLLTDGRVPPPERADDAGRNLVLPPEAAAERNLELIGLGHADRLEAGAEARVVLGWAADRDGSCPIEILVDGEAIRRVDLDFHPGSGELVVMLDPGSLAPGRHRLEARAEIDDDEDADDRVGGLIEILPRRRPILIDGGGAADEGSALARALEAQGLEVESIAASGIATAGLAERCSLLVLDRVAPDAIDADGARQITDFVAEGGGLILLPREDRDELLAWNRHPLAPLLPLAGLPEPRLPPEKDEKTAPEDDPGKKLSDPDPERKEEKEVDAPTHIMLLVIDASASMEEGSRMTYARRGAVATLRKLHPEDRIGVIAFNDRPTEVVPVQPAANADDIERAITRIEPDGATDIEAALLFAQATLERETAAVKTIVLLSDGAGRPFNDREVAQRIRASGITIITVGVGSEFEMALLTRLAKHSGGIGPIPARNARQLPAVMVDVAARLIDRNGLRKAPERPEPARPDDGISRPETRIENGSEPRRPPAGNASAGDGEGEPRLEIEAARPASFLDGIDLGEAPSLAGCHRAETRSGALTSLKLEDGRPLLSYWRRGDGVVAMAAFPWEGAWAARFLLWDSFSPLLAQLARFAERDPSRSDLDFVVDLADDHALVDILDSRRRQPGADWRFAIGDRTLEARDLGAGRWRIELPPDLEPPLAVVTAQQVSAAATYAFALAVRPPEEIRERGLDLPGLEAWRRALAARLLSAPDGDLLPPPRSETRRLPAAFDLGLALVALAILELALKRRAASRILDP
ncbi:MAG: VWA domain-containing protein [Planctomycetes bacterium]|nr:VWA domain-containing protein [Planctomycetota bacterium]